MQSFNKTLLQLVVDVGTGANDGKLFCLSVDNIEVDAILAYRSGDSGQIGCGFTDIVLVMGQVTAGGRHVKSQLIRVFLQITTEITVVVTGQIGDELTAALKFAIY